MLIELEAVYDLKIHQMNVKTTFLNGDLEEEIDIIQPEGFVVPRKKEKVQTCEVTLGLEQAPNQ